VNINIFVGLCALAIGLVFMFIALLRVSKLFENNQRETRNMIRELVVSLKSDTPEAVTQNVMALHEHDEYIRQQAEIFDKFKDEEDSTEKNKEDVTNIKFKTVNDGRQFELL
jgi:uncharacterized protein YneF (UPF0154 family)